MLDTIQSRDQELHERWVAHLTDMVREGIDPRLAGATMLAVAIGARKAEVGTPIAAQGLCSAALDMMASHGAHVAAQVRDLPQAETQRHNRGH